MYNIVFCLCVYERVYVYIYIYISMQYHVWSRVLIRMSIVRVYTGRDSRYSSLPVLLWSRTGDTLDSGRVMARKKAKRSRLSKVEVYS